MLAVMAAQRWAEDRIPNQQAIELSPMLGWIMLWCAVALFAIVLLNHEVVRRLWLRAEDPRAMAVVRIGFGLCAIGTIAELSDQWLYLFSDEGIFFTDTARYCFAREQFSGFGNGVGGDPYGFFDARAVWEWLKGPKWSLLFFWDSPAFVYAHLIAFFLAAGAMTVGLWTGVTKWIAWFLFHSIILRNNLFWEGTENVFRTFFFLVCLSRCGQAYSVDNWLRCRRLRAAGRLSERDGPGGGAGLAPCDAHPHGLAAIYRRIPAWPRMLLILQIAALYCYTGVVKNGHVWSAGDSFYYALNLDHFYRFPPQQISAVFGTNLFRLSTHVTHWWEALFPVVVVGLYLRAIRREGLPPPGRALRLASRGAWIALALGAAALVYEAYPVHYRETARVPSLQRARDTFLIAWATGCVAIGWTYLRLQRGPWPVRVAGRAFTVTLEGISTWVLGRRVWLLLGLTFHMHLIIMMNIGWFTPGLLSGYPAFLNGGEVAMILAGMGAGLATALRKVGLAGLLPADVRAGLPPIPPEDPSLPHLHHDGVRVPSGALLLALVLALGGVVLQVRGMLDMRWSAAGVLAFLAGSLLREARRRPRPQLEVRQPGAATRAVAGAPRHAAPLRAPWAYGPWGRLAAGALCVWQVTGTAVWLLPEKDSFKAWRPAAQEPFRWWLLATQTTQGWNMFAPNPPRSNLFMKVLVTDAAGEVWDLNTDVYHPAKRPIPWLFYTRERKMSRRISGAEGGGGTWYAKWHARYICRKWQLDHDGELPTKVELVKLWYGIPAPEWVQRNGPYDPVERLRTQGRQQVFHTTVCRDEPDAQLPDVIRARHGLGPSDVDVKRWSSVSNRYKEWQAKQAAADRPAAKPAPKPVVKPESKPAAQPESKASLRPAPVNGRPPR